MKMEALNFVSLNILSSMAIVFNAPGQRDWLGDWCFHLVSTIKIFFLTKAITLAVIVDSACKYSMVNGLRMKHYI